MNTSVAKIPLKLKTIHDWICWAMKAFKKAGLYFGHGTDSALDEAAYLVLHSLNLPLDLDSSHWNKKVFASEAEKVFSILMKRMIMKKPSAYLTRQAFFAGLSFYVDERVLIPRSPMAELIAQKFSPWISQRKVTNILDLCTGSGCIAIACAKVFPKAKVFATDISKEALAVAKMNVKKYKLSEKIKLKQSDLFKNIGNKKFDIIISNPPYVDAKEMASLPKEYRHEPKLALAAGKDGLKLVDKILHEAKNHLTPNGILVVEVGNSAAALMKKYPHVPFVWLNFAHGEGEVFLLPALVYSFYF